MSEENNVNKPSGDKSESRQIHSSIKIAINAGLMMCLTLALFLVGVFVLDRFSIGKENSLSYWLQKGLTAFATFMLMLTSANITEEARKKKDKALNDRVRALDSHYDGIMENGDTDDLEKLLNAFNCKNKYEAYIQKYKRKYNKLVEKKRAWENLVTRFNKIFCKLVGKNPKDVKRHNSEILEEKLLKLEGKLLLSPEEVFDDARNIRYSKVTFSQMVSGEFDVSSKEDDFDIQIHKTRFALKKLMWKIISVVAFGGIVADFAFSFQDFNKGMILQMVLKVVLTLIATYSGVCFGYFIVDRIKTVLKRKLRIYSQFDARKSSDLIGDEKWIVTIPNDKTIDKIRAKHSYAPCDSPKFNGSDKIEECIENEPKPLKTHYSALNETYEETFGASKPVKAGEFVGKLVENTLKNEAKKNVENMQNTLDTTTMA